MTPRLPKARLRAAMTHHAADCRSRLRLARLASAPNIAGRVAQTIRLDLAERRSVAVWVRQGLSRTDAVRLAIDPALRPERRP